jgi:hypothetical protein
MNLDEFSKISMDFWHQELGLGQTWRSKSESMGMESNLFGKSSWKPSNQDVSCIFKQGYCLGLLVQTSG